MSYVSVCFRLWACQRGKLLRLLGGLRWRHTLSSAAGEYGLHSMALDVSWLECCRDECDDGDEEQW